jgi:hypothetical protein
MTALLLTALLGAEPAALSKRHWDCSSTAHFRICAAPGLATGSVAADAEKALAATLRFIGVARYSHRIYLFALSSPREMQSLINAYGSGASHPEEHAVFLVPALAKGDDLMHELNHEVVTGLWGKSEFWIAEGLAAYAADPAGIDERCRTAFAERWSLTLAEMVRPDWNAGQDPYPARAIYPMLGSFVKYLKETYGLDAVRKVWMKGSASIPAVFGKPLAALDRDWRESVKSAR